MSLSLILHVMDFTCGLYRQNVIHATADVVPETTEQGTLASVTD